MHGPDGAELCRHSDAQHNRNYSARIALMDQLAADALAALAAADAATPTGNAEAEAGCDQDAEGAEHEPDSVTEEAESCVLPPRNTAGKLPYYD